jgi:hypothetical protein
MRPMTQSWLCYQHLDLHPSHLATLSYSTDVMTSCPSRHLHVHFGDPVRNGESRRCYRSRRHTTTVILDPRTCISGHNHQPQGHYRNQSSEQARHFIATYMSEGHGRSIRSLWLRKVCSRTVCCGQCGIPAKDDVPIAIGKTEFIFHRNLCKGQSGEYIASDLHCPIRLWSVLLLVENIDPSLTFAGKLSFMRKHVVKDVVPTGTGQGCP